MTNTNLTQIHATGDKGKPITVIGTNSIRADFDATCLQQALNARGAPGVTDLVLNPGAHAGYGAPVGCVLTSPTHIYPGPVGVDIKCSMSFLQFDLPADQVTDRPPGTHRCDCRTHAHWSGSRAAFGAQGPQGRRSARREGSDGRCVAGGVAHTSIPLDWAERCEDAAHVGHDGTSDSLALRLEWVRANQFSNFLEKITQLGSYGGGNHFGECEVVRLLDNDRARRAGEVFGLRDGCSGFRFPLRFARIWSRVGERTIPRVATEVRRVGHSIAGADKELVYAPFGTPEADAYLDDLALGANFATLPRPNASAPKTSMRRDQRALRSCFTGCLALSPSRPRPFRPTASALVTSDVRSSIYMSCAFRLRLGARHCALASLLYALLSSFAPLSASPPQTEGWTRPSTARHPGYDSIAGRTREV